MKTRTILKQSDTVVGLVRDLRKLPGLFGIPSRRIIRRNRIINSYLASNKTRKLQIGAGPNSLDGWLSTDISRKDHVAFLDATKPFPFDDDTFDFIFSEHMIEHISRDEGLFMLQECRRVLKPGGTIRIATPDLDVLIDLYNGKENPLKERYIKWITDRFLKGVNVYKAAFVINNAFHCWGHKFLYDGELLEMAMRETGFTNIKRCSSGESDNEDLRGIESHGDAIFDYELAAFETMVYEAKCPA